MPASNATGGFGVILRRNGVPIAELTNIEPPEITRDTFEKTTHQSPGRVKEFGKALLEMGEISIEGNWIPSESTQGTAGLLGDFSNHTSNDTYAIVFPDVASTTWSGPGILTNFKGASPREEGMTLKGYHRQGVRTGQALTDRLRRLDYRYKTRIMGSAWV